MNKKFEKHVDFIDNKYTIRSMAKPNIKKTFFSSCAIILLIFIIFFFVLLDDTSISYIYNCTIFALLISGLISLIEYIIFISSPAVIIDTNERLIKSNSAFFSKIANFEDIKIIGVSAGYMPGSLIRCNKIIAAFDKKKRMFDIISFHKPKKVDANTFELFEINEFAQELSKAIGCKFLEGEENIELEITSYPEPQGYEIKRTQISEHGSIFDIFKSKNARKGIISIIFFLVLSGLQIYVRILDEDEKEARKAVQRQQEEINIKKEIEEADILSGSLSLNMKENASDKEIMKEFDKESVFPPSNPPLKMSPYIPKDWVEQKFPLINLPPTQISSLDLVNDYYINENFGNLIACLEEIILCIYTLEHIAIDCPELKEKSDLLRNKVITTFNPAIMQLVKSGENFKNDKNELLTLENITKEVKEIYRRDVNPDNKDDLYYKNINSWLYEEKYNLEKAKAALEFWETHLAFDAENSPKSVKELMLIHPAVIKCDVPYLFKTFCNNTKRIWGLGSLGNNIICVNMPLPFYWQSINSSSPDKKYSCLRDGVIFLHRVSTIDEKFKNGNARDNIYNELNIKDNSNVIKEKVGKYDSIIIKYRDSTTENIKEIVKKAFYFDKSLNKDIDQTIYTCHKQFNIIHNNKYIIKLDFSVSAFSEEEAIARIKRNEAMFDNIAKNINIEVYNEKEKQEK